MKKRLLVMLKMRFKRYDITINDIGISEFAIDMDASFEQKRCVF